MLKMVLVGLSSLAFSSFAFADLSAIKSSNNQISIQTMSTNVDYTETGNGRLGTASETLDTETGDVPGYGAFISMMSSDTKLYFDIERSEERRVGKECRSRWS